MGDISVWGWGGVGEWVGVSGWGGGYQYKEILSNISPMKFYKGISL